MKPIIAIIIAAVGSTVAVEINKILLAAGLAKGQALLVSSVTAATFYAVCVFLIIDLPLRLRFCRRILDRRAKYEGFYVETFSELGARPVGVARITYNPESKSYSYWGRAFDLEGNLKATWRALDMHIDVGDGIARYFFEATIIGNNPQSVRGYGVIEFNIGSGFFVDSGSGLAEWHHNIYRLNRRDLVELVGTKHIPKEENWGTLAVSYMKRKNNT